MKLTIKRSQAGEKGVFGAHKGVAFCFSARVELTEEERRIFGYYNLMDHILVTDYVPGGGGNMMIRLSDLIKGLSDTNGIGRLAKLERQIKEECQQLKELADVMSKYGGEETIEIDGA